MKKFFTLGAAMLAAVSMASAQDGCYVIGEVNDQGWDPAVGVAMTAQGNDVYTATVDVKGWFGITLGLSESGSWDELNAMRLYPANGESNVNLVDNKAVIDLSTDKNGGDAWTLGAAAEGVKLTVDLNALTLTIETSGEVEVDENIYVVGDLSGWSFDPAYKMENNNGVYTIKNVEILGGFKLANPGWGKYNYGCAYEGEGDDAVAVQPTLGAAYNAQYDGGNLVINNDAETAFTVNIKLDLTGEAAVLTISEAAGIEGVAVDNNAPAVYYNLQGVQVANPVNGLFIVKQGEKVSKVIVK